MIYYTIAIVIFGVTCHIFTSCVLSGTMKWHIPSVYYSTLPINIAYYSWWLFETSLICSRIELKLRLMTRMKWRVRTVINSEADSNYNWIQWYMAGNGFIPKSIAASLHLAPDGDANASGVPVSRYLFWTGYRYSRYSQCPRFQDQTILKLTFLNKLFDFGRHDHWLTNRFLLSY